MAGLFSAPKLPPIAATPAPTISNPQAAASAQQQMYQQSQAKGPLSTILTGGLGVAGAAPVQKKALLGQ